MEIKKLKIKKIEPYSPKWEGLANELARSLLTIKPCKECGYPIMVGYCCGTCGSESP